LLLTRSFPLCYDTVNETFRYWKAFQKEAYPYEKTG
jgi:hypothetical protein